LPLNLAQEFHFCCLEDTFCVLATKYVHIAYGVQTALNYVLSPTLTQRWRRLNTLGTTASGYAQNFINTWEQ